LNPSPNSDDDSGGSRLLLFPRGGLLFSLSKIPNPPNGFAPMVSKYKKYHPLIFPVFVILFGWLLLPAVASVIVPIS